MEPLMNKSEIHIIERTLEELVAGKDKLRVLEWGSGGSTLHFTRFMQNHNIDYEWVSLEYNKNWYKKVKDAVAHDSNIEIVLFDVGNDRLKQRDIPMDEYVVYPRTLGKKFDMVLVDGRKRRRCVLEAKHILAPGGVVFLHDAQRPYYHPAFSEFPDRRFASLFLWRGKNEIPCIGNRVRNIFSTFFFRTLYFIFIAPPQWVKRKLLPWRKRRAKAKAIAKNSGLFL